MPWLSSFVRLFVSVIFRIKYFPGFYSHAQYEICHAFFLFLNIFFLYFLSALETLISTSFIVNYSLCLSGEHPNKQWTLEIQFVLKYKPGENLDPFRKTNQNENKRAFVPPTLHTHTHKQLNFPRPYMDLLDNL